MTDVAKHRAALLQTFPETWTHVKNLNMLQIGFRLKVLGIDWRSNADLGAARVILTREGILEMDGVLMQRGAE